MSIIQLAIAIFLIPAGMFSVLAVFHNRLPALRDKLATAAIGLCLFLSLIIFFRAFWGDEPLFVRWTFEWFPVSGSKSLTGGILVDGLTAIMLVVVNLVSFLVHLFSIKYMEGDKRYGRYYVSLLLFTTSMLGLVLADNLLFLFVFWELVGLSSYVLIGHWFEKKSAANAALKAFITTRIGDIGMLLGMLICYWKVGSLDYVQLFDAAAAGMFNAGSEIDWQFWAGIGLFFGAMGKSAQFPFHVWLPDAMEGPTPVSALIHAATMVAAGVYLVGRLFPLFTPDAFLFIAYIGAITALFAATIATVQDDIKKVLAYSTLSQLGYMMLALGAGGYVAGLFHLTTHAFFKAGLFLGSGSIILAMHHEQRMSRYGGLWRKLPITGITYLACVLAIIGCPPFAGFFSKDAILAKALEFSMEHPTHWFLAFSGFATVFLTAFYMFRQFFLTFTGRPRDAHAYEHARESPWQMTAPLVILGSLAVFSGWFPSWFDNIMPPHEARAVVETYEAYHREQGEPFELVSAGITVVSAAAIEGGEEGAAEEHEEDHGSAYGIAMALSILLAGLGVVVAWLAFFQKADGRTRVNPAAVAARIRPIHTLLWNKYYFDEFYGIAIVGVTLLAIRMMATFDRYVVDALVNFVGLLGKISAFVVGIVDNWIVDGAVNLVGWVTAACGRGLSYSQTGRARNYLLFIVLGVMGLSVILIFVI